MKVVRHGECNGQEVSPVRCSVGMRCVASSSRLAPVQALRAAAGSERARCIAVVQRADDRESWSRVYV
jgi:hypothetical protein